MDMKATCQIDLDWQGVECHQHVSNLQQALPASEFGADKLAFNPDRLVF
jgi:hypothetical protein